MQSRGVQGPQSGPWREGDAAHSSRFQMQQRCVRGNVGSPAAQPSEREIKFSKELNRLKIEVIEGNERISNSEVKK